MTIQPILLTNALLVDGDILREGRGAVLVKDGLIADVFWGEVPTNLPPSVHEIDCKGQIICPGLIDLQAFVGEPGAEHRETIAGATQSAASGGITTLLAMPETSPVIDDPAVVDFLLRRIRDTALIRVLPAAALTKGLEGKEIAEIGLLQEAGVVAFSNGSKSLSNAQMMPF
jgi:dihydroorotase